MDSDSSQRQTWSDSSYGQTADRVQNLMTGTNVSEFLNTDKINLSLKFAKSIYLIKNCI